MFCIIYNIRGGLILPIKYRYCGSVRCCDIQDIQYFFHSKGNNKLWVHNIPIICYFSFSKSESRHVLINVMFIKKTCILLRHILLLYFECFHHFIVDDVLQSVEQDTWDGDIEERQRSGMCPVRRALVVWRMYECCYVFPGQKCCQVDIWWLLTFINIFFIQL